MKSKLPQLVNWAQPQWQHAASGIRCRADWRNAYVYETDAGLIIAYSQSHANEKAREVIENGDVIRNEDEQEQQFWDEDHI